MPSVSSPPGSQLDSPPEPTAVPAMPATAQPLKLTLIVATTPITSASNPAIRRLGIGHNGDLPWPRVKSDMGFFARVTSRPPPTTTSIETSSAFQAPPYPSDSTTTTPAINAVIMGRKTYDSIPEKFRPLSKRFNVIISRDRSGELQRRVAADWKAARRRQRVRERERERAAKFPAPGGPGATRDSTLAKEEEEEEEEEKGEPEALVANSVESALSSLRSDFGSWYPGRRLGNVFVIGGAQIYESVLRVDPLRVPGCSIRLLMTDVRRPGRGSHEEPWETPRLSTTDAATPSATTTPGYDPSQAVDGFECTTFFPLTLDDIEGSREWRRADSSEVTEWVGEEVTSEWKWEGDTAIRIRGYEKR